MLLSMVYGLWSMVYGLWSMVYGLWSTVYGLWSMVYGLRSENTVKITRSIDTKMPAIKLAFFMSFINPSNNYTNHSK